MSAARPSSYELPPSLRDTATGAAAWMRLVVLWAPLSIGALCVLDGQDGVRTAVAFVAALALFAVLSVLEIRHAAGHGMRPLAAGALLVTDAVVVLLLAVTAAVVAFGS